MLIKKNFLTKKFSIFILIFINFFIYHKKVYATTFTETGYTLDAGVIQVESSIFDYSQNGDVNTWSIHPFNLRIGLDNSVDVQLVFEPYINQESNKKVNDGNGDFQISIKKNIWGNDDGKSALGLMPYIKLPTADNEIGNDKVEGGIIFPFSTNVSDAINLDLMFETDFVYDDDEQNFDTEFVISGLLGIKIQNSLGLYSEIITIKSDDVDYKVSNIIGFGATYSLSKNLIFDVGLNHRLLGKEDDFNIFSGYTFLY